MPFQSVNFANVPTQGYTALRNLAPTIAQGYQTGALPGQLSRQKRAEELRNTLEAVRAQYLPQQMEQEAGLNVARLAQIQQQTEKARQEAAQKQMISNMLKQAFGGGQGGEGGSQGTMGPAGGSDLPRVMFRKLAGIPIETPGEKSGREFESFKQKEEFRALQPTQTTKTREDRIISSTVPLFQGLEELKNTSFIHPHFNKRAESIGENFAVIKNFPKGEGGNQRAIDILHPSQGELAAGLFGGKMYEKRIDRELQLLAPEAAEIFKKRGKPVPPEVKRYLPSSRGEEIKEEITVEVIAPNGKTYNVPQERVEEVIKEGGRRAGI